MHNEQSTIIANDHGYKIVFLGDASVGKTSIVQYIMNGSARTNYQATIFLESAKKLVIHKNQIYKLMLWDTAGQQKFNSLIPSFVRGCDCAIIVYDVTSKKSLQNCQKWLKILTNQRYQNQTAIILIGNKIDLQRNITTEMGFDLAIKHKLAFVQTSTRNGKGIEKLVQQIIDNIQKNKNKSQKQTKSSEGETHHKLNTSQKLNNSQKLSASRIVHRGGVSSQLKINKPNSCCSV